MKKKLNPTERFILLSIFLMFGVMLLPNLNIETNWENSMKVQGSTRNVQLAVDSFVAKKAIQPTENEGEATCTNPQKVDISKIKEAARGIDENSLYFIDFFGTVWNETGENLLTVTKQMDSLVFNNIGADKYEILEVDKGSCDNRNVMTTVYPENEKTIQVQIKDSTKEYLVQPVFGNKKGMPVGEGFDGRLFQ